MNANLLQLYVRFHIRKKWHINDLSAFFPTPSLREKCPNTEFFLVRIFLYSVWIQENTDQKNSVFGHFSNTIIYKDNCGFDHIYWINP